MENMDTNIEFTLKEYYGILANMCAILEQDPDNDTALTAFADAAYNLGKANCGYLFPDDLYASDIISDNAAKTPADGCVITSVKEEDDNVVH